MYVEPVRGLFGFALGRTPALVHPHLRLSCLVLVVSVLLLLVSLSLVSGFAFRFLVSCFRLVPCLLYLTLTLGCTIGFQILSLDAIRRTTAHLPRIGGESGGDGRGELEDWAASIDVAKVRCAV